MSQHDFDISNQSFPATRSDLNNALKALASNSSGTTAPTTTYANQWFYNTSNDTLYLRNEANTAWIAIAVVDQTNSEVKLIAQAIQANDSDGLLLKTDDGTTRINIADSGTVTIDTVDINGGTIDGVTLSATTINGSGNMNIDSGTLFVDSTNNRVGVGTTTPQTNLVISDSSNGLEIYAGATVILSSYNRTSAAYIPFRVDASEVNLTVYGTTKAKVTNGGDFQFDSGYGSVATAYGCRAWVNFNGSGTVAIRDSGNVSSVTDNAAGDYSVNFTTSMPDANYSVSGMAGVPSANTAAYIHIRNVATPLTAFSARVAVLSDGGTYQDPQQACVSIFR